MTSFSNFKKLIDKSRRQSEDRINMYLYSIDILRIKMQISTRSRDKGDQDLFKDNEDMIKVGKTLIGKLIFFIRY